MSIYLDDQAVTLEGANLGAVLEAANRQVGAGGRIVVEVTLGGRPLVGDELARRAGEPLDGRELRLVTADPGELVAQVLAELRGLLGTIRSEQQEIADLLQRDQQLGAMEKLSAVMEGWQQLHQGVVQALTVLDTRIDLQQIKVRQYSAAQVLTITVERLKELRKLVSVDDSLALADALLYEWPTAIDLWDDLLAGIIRSAQRRRP